MFSAYPDPAGPDTAQNAYVFERGVTFQHRGGKTSTGRIDLYKRGCFNLRAAAITEPVLHKFQNIENRDAVLAYDREEFITAKMVEADPKIPGLPDNWRDAVQPHTGYLCVWDRKTTKTDPVTGRQVPDGKAIVPLRRYVNPRPAWWPQADFIVGNPPFLGASRMRDDRGSGYAETLRAAYPEVTDSADFVMFWWYKAGEETLAGRTRRFSFITTNSIRQTFNRRVVQSEMDKGIYLTFAIPDHPWVDAAACSAVRLAMTVGARRGDLPPINPATAKQGSASNDPAKL